MSTHTPISATEHLAALHAGAEEVLREVDELVAELDLAALAWRPASDAWGVGDVLEHLIATGDAYYPRVRAALSAESPEGTPPADEYRPSWFGRLFVRLAGPNGPVRIRALRPFRPREPGPETVERFRASQLVLLALIEAAAFTDLQRLTVPHPSSRLLTLSLGECLTMLVEHQRRHLVQLRRVVLAVPDRVLPVTSVQQPAPASRSGSRS